ncbi:MAG: hypothetical protein R3304_08705 [Longimicrobiales bacterium]|nr:hypothetical protein [Longimicrobiales bacterium]
MTPRRAPRRGGTRARRAALRTTGALLTAGAALLGEAGPGAAQAASRCDDVPGFHALDFRVGEWTVWVEGEQVGTNRITKVLSGCAVEEHWEAAGGGRGRSLFYDLPAESAWRQVWVTQRALLPGGVEEKRQMDSPAGGVRFQGTVTRPDGATYLDRTTLTPLAGGQVRQHIETSTDGGATWRTTFDAEYRPAGA